MHTIQGKFNQQMERPISFLQVNLHMTCEFIVLLWGMDSEMSAALKRCISCLREFKRGKIPRVGVEMYYVLP